MSRARNIWRAISDFNRDVAAFQGRLWMALVYFLVLAPIALLVRISSNPLLPPFEGDSYSHERKAPAGTLDDARRQGA